MAEKIFVIIVTFNGLRWIDDCIKSIYVNDCNNIIIIDNASKDGTIEFIQKNYPSVELIKLEKNVGFGAANNIGIKIAMQKGSDFFFLLNQDAYLTRNALSDLVAEMKHTSNVGIISPLHLNGSGTAFDTNFLTVLIKGTDGAFVNDLYFNKLKRVYSVPIVNAAAWLLNKNCIEKVGYFDSIFFHYGEDNNYCQRVQYHGLDIKITTRAKILHDREDRNGGVRTEFLKDEDLRRLLVDMCNPFEDTKQAIEVFNKKTKKEILKAILKMNRTQLKKAIRRYSYINKRSNSIIANTTFNQQNRIN